MSLGIDAAIVFVLIYSAYSGTKRGLVLIGLELISFAVATVTALLAYHQVGGFAKSIGHMPNIALGNITAFVIIWVLVEVLCALFFRFVVMPRLNRQIQLSRSNKIGGALFNILKSAAIVTLAVIVFSGLPLSPATKQPVTSAFIPSHLMMFTGDLPAMIAAGLGRDLNDSLNVFTVEADPESEQKIDLGYTTTKVTVDAQAEADMLVLLNKERTSRGLPALTANNKARAVARTYSTDMFARGFFSHVDPEGRTPFDRMKAGGVQFGSAGENLALAPTLQLAHDGLMKSPGHRANILSESYRTVGIGIIDGGPYGLMVTQDFTD